MRSTDLVSLSRVLVYGEPATRRAAAARLLREGQPADWALLATTLRSASPWQLRARCLEALGLAAGQADRATAETILDLVCATSSADQSAGPGKQD